jgi:hypothetical protein
MASHPIGNDGNVTEPTISTSPHPGVQSDVDHTARRVVSASPRTIRDGAGAVLDREVNLLLCQRRTESAAATYRACDVAAVTNSAPVVVGSTCSRHTDVGGGDRSGETGVCGYVPD